jgi:putative transposase
MPKPLNYFDIEIYGGTLVTRVHSDVGGVPLRLFGVEINALRAYLTELGANNLLFEIQPTSALNAEQIRGMVFFAREVRQRGGTCAFCGGGPEVQQTLSRFGLSKPADWSPMLAEGLVALGGGSAYPNIPGFVPVPAAPLMPTLPAIAVPSTGVGPAPVQPAAAPSPPASRPASAGHTNRSAPRDRLLPAHELTLRANRRQTILESDLVCSHLAERIREESDRFDFSVWAFVFMPDHFHLLVHTERLSSDIGAYLDAVKQSFQERAIEILAEQSPQLLGRLRSQQGGRTTYDLWQLTTGQNRNVDFSRPVRPLIDHLHENPVRKGLVMEPLEWKWSSAGSYAGQPLPELQHTPVPPELLDR